MNKEDVVLIIPHYDADLPNKALNICLDSLRKSEFPMKNVIVALNGEYTDASLSEEFGTRWIWIPEQGQCKAVNAAAAIAQTEWIMVSNNDMVYPKDWFEKLTSFWITDPQELITDENILSHKTPKIREFGEDNICISPILIEPQDGAPTFIRHFCGGLGGDWQPEKWKEFLEDYQGSGIRSGFNLPFLIKKEVWDLIGGYDVQYDPWGSNSDSDFEYKLKLSGVPMYQNTNCPVYHFSQTSGTFHPSVREYWQKNWDYFIEKWGIPRTDDGIWQATFEIPMEKLSFHPFWEGFYSRKKNG